MIPERGRGGGVWWAECGGVWGAARGGVALASWERCWWERGSLTDSLIIEFLAFASCFTAIRPGEGTDWGDTLCFAGSALRLPIRNNWLPSERRQGGIFLQHFKGMKFWGSPASRFGLLRDHLQSIYNHTPAGDEVLTESFSARQ